MIVQPLHLRLKITTIDWSHQKKKYELVDTQKAKLRSPSAVFGSLWSAIRSLLHTLLLLINYTKYARKSLENAGERIALKT